MTRTQAYEYLKTKWLAENPHATAEKIEAAFRAIAQRVGL